MSTLNADIMYRALLILLTVSMVSAGQVLFKYVSLMIAAGQPVMSVKVMAVIVSAFFISGCGSLVYIGLLRTMSLSAAYPFMALSFVMVPACGVILFGDNLRGPYYLGIALIILGIIVITRQS